MITKEEKSMDEGYVAMAIAMMESKRRGLGKNAGPWGKTEYQTATVALRKQVPKKPVMDSITRSVFEPYCPICGAVLGDYGYTEKETSVHYCPECGQRLKVEGR